MTTRARWALEDSKSAYDELLANEDVYAWRRRWLTVVALLRVVGHVLHKVDAEQNDKLKNSIDDWWRKLKHEKNDNEIFWSFIDSERNTLLKEYTTHAQFKESVTSNYRTKEILTEFSSVFTEGVFEGRETVEVVKEAIEWWECQLEIIDENAV